MAKSLEHQLSNACRYGDLNLVKDLVNKGADIHAFDDQAFCISAYHGYLGIIKYLVFKGANIHARDEFVLRNSSCIHVEIIRYLEGIILREKRKKIWPKI